MKKIALITTALTLLSVAACKNNEVSSSSITSNNTSSSVLIEEVNNNLAPKIELGTTQSWDLMRSPYNMDSVLNPLLQPYWHTREIYNETFMFIGKEGEVELLYEPSEILISQDYRFKEVYEEGVDFVIEGKKIKRTINSSMPYIEASDYWVDEATKVAGEADKESNITFQKVVADAEGPKEYKLTGQRYLKVRENIWPEYHQCVISYKHNNPFPENGFYPQSKGITNFINKLKNEKEASIVFYGDSITEGWTASGHLWEWSIEPHMSSWVRMVESYLEKKYEASIDVVNEAIGGWTTGMGLANYDIKMNGNVAHRHATENEDRSHGKLNPDLLVLGFGMNDWTLDPDSYRSLIAKMVSKYYEDNPNGNVILISSMPAHVDTEIEGNQKYFEEELKLIAHNYEGTLVAPVYSMYQQLFSMGKDSKDILSNNVNHPNDFGVRTYAQVVLKTLLGSEFCDESIKVNK